MNALLEQYGLSRTKLAVIAGLVALLVGVWGNALLGSGGSRSAKRKPRPATHQSEKSRTNNQTTTAPVTQRITTPQLTVNLPLRDLPPADVSHATKLDPFALPAWARNGNAPTPQATVSISEREATLEQLRTTGVSMVVLTDGKKVARIGGRHVRPGDTLSGHRVLDITPSGVVLSDEPIKSAKP